MKDKRTPKQCKGGSCSGSYLRPNEKLCDWCLLHRYDLNCHYDSEDHEGLSPMFSEDDVVAALRKATGL